MSAAPLDLDALLGRMERLVLLTQRKNAEIGADDGMASLRCSDLAALVAAARRGVEDTEDAERWRFARDHSQWIRRVDDDGVEQTYFEVCMLPGANLSSPGMRDYAMDRLAARAHPEDTTDAK